MSVVRIGVSFLLSLLLMLLFLVNELCFATSSTLLNSLYYSKTLNQVGYYTHLKTELEQGLINTGLAAGLPKEVFVNAVDRTWLEQEGNAYITGLIDYLSLKRATLHYEFNGKPLEAKLSLAMVNYGQQMMMPITPDDLAATNALLLQNVQEHIVVVSPQNPLLTSLRKYTALIVLDRWVLVSASLFLLLCLFLVNRKRFAKFMAWLAYSCIAAGLLLVIPASLLLYSSVLTRLALQDVYLRQAVGALLEGFVQVSFYAGLATLLAGLVFLFCTLKGNMGLNVE